MATRDDLKQLIETVLGLKVGTYLVLTTPSKESMGQAKVIPEKPTIAKVYAAISTPERKCQCCDTITLSLPGAGSRQRRIVMFVDDTGMLDNLPTNHLAFYVANTIKGYPHDIHGTAVVVNDQDFR